MDEVRYVCTGSCHGMVTEQEYQSGKTNCAAEDCDKYGEALKKMMYCPGCDVIYREEEGHSCCAC